jgi:hypothetical protein
MHRLFLSSWLQVIPYFSYLFTRLSYHLIHFPNIGIESDAPVEPIPEERLFEPAPLSPIGSAIFFCYSFIIS